ncbi:UDP-N-acetylmuramoyl-L-alanine--D-glutamate ligase [Corynebacterium bovis]|uniref:UDP-N-acetylmuramoylalanine--D-glutamate ligase n=10 Tax=Corynebacterium bovis TaxID=36808 RepID=A0A426Q6C6_9CORY|nr:UDP-N-acetylmuramoyl-L-alanine--D-glutamate ligase [Corynebacterium bovis]RRO99011.1 UDP-N-acetylmuramoyl-L-alanine--D-glutamate ligase [Corynebacterium bovis]RRQ04995.1 UDP-N-acetylmuramoyl-L-alanine--D-glutamate ligase [Corynebacterium bovis]RRQ05859.1 UDP-N-acetylmuramoyl-L-alanine--D-glutamate ligase [Corynebacterium bovis]RRQ08643.1 UDP-N-acetylmuramoyl-L-alanine--D-glutamate ligase [Corynebacterium bovis]
MNPTVTAMTGGHVLVAGAGVAGRGAARLLAHLGARVTVADDDADRSARLAAECGGRRLGVTDACDLLATGHPPAGDDPLPAVDLVVMSPGWRPGSPLPRAAAEAGVPVVGDLDVARSADAAGLVGPSRTWIVLTGTNGKTTTTAMTAAILRADGRSAAAVGNIGASPAEQLLADERTGVRTDVLVVEASSFQLHWSRDLHPDVGCVLNLAEDHLDWHGDMTAYAADKATCLTGAVAVLAADDPAVLVAAEPVVTGRRRAFTVGDPQAAARALGTTGPVVGVRDGRLVETDGPDRGETVDLAPADGISPPGPAGVADAAAAASLARAVGVTPGAVARALGSFTVAPHRGQVVHREPGPDGVGEIRWIDNSKATNPHAAYAALAGLDGTVWVAGGQLKGADVDDLVRDVAPRLRGAVLLGADRAVIARALARHAPSVPVTVVDGTDPATVMGHAVRAARTLARPGDTVVLAPAAASLDMFDGMSHRGDLFARYACSTREERDQ